MGLSEQINAIIRKRQERLPDITHKLEELDSMEQFVSEMEELRREMITEDGEEIPGSRFEVMLRTNPEMVWGLQALSFNDVYAAINEARLELQNYERRCKRDTVNISVVGVAGSGKSALLQAISGLSGKVIPSFESTDCTGAPSVIVNEQRDGLNVHLTFKSRDEMRDMAQTYLDQLVPDDAQRPHLHSMEQIRTLNTEQISSLIPDGDAESSLLEFLEKMVVHYDEWSVYAGAADMDLNDENEIITFVSQHNGMPVNDPGREEYYKYLAVSTCTITCRFPTEDDIGRICLIDTVGLGDYTVGLMDSMLKTVNERSDAVIVTHRPRTSRKLDVLPVALQDGYQKISEICGDRALDKWLFYLINNDISNPTSNEACQVTLTTLDRSKFYGRDNAKIINVMDRQAVMDGFLIPMLEQVAGDLDEIDETYRSPAQKSLDSLRDIYRNLCGGAQKVLRSDIRTNANLAPKINALSRESFGNLRAALFRFMKSWKEKREQSCPSVYSSSEAIFGRMTQKYLDDFYLPSEKAVLDRLNRGELAADIYKSVANSVRNAVSGDFLNVDILLADEVTAMKNDLAKILYDTCDLKKICPAPEEDASPSVWLDRFCENILDSEDEYPNLLLAFSTIRKFRFSVKGFLTYEVRNGLDSLDLAWIDVPPLIDPKGNDSVTAANIAFQLYSVLCNIKANLEIDMKSLCIKPNRAIYAEVMDFYDRIIYADGVEMEWNDLFSNYAVELWGDTLKAQEQAVTLCQEWLTAVDSLRRCCAEDTFSLK